MKTCFPTKTLMALAVAAVAAVNYQTQAGETIVSTSANSATLPAGILPDSPVGQVFKLAQAGVDANVIQSYISNCPSDFNLRADDIIALTDAGVSSGLINAMYAHDKALSAPAVAAAAPPLAAPAPPIPSAEQAGSPPPVPTVGTDTAPVPTVAPTDLSQDEIDQTLSPYGSWVQVDGYGLCWRPSVVVYDATWQPYCDRGSWVYTDYGWYWNSDYAWGVTFHYGRWFNSPQYGWCWWPNNVWAPAWVAWRSSNAYCGWAPLPPFSVYQPGIGFVYRGNHVALGFDFGLAASCFTFVSVGHFCDPHPRYYCVPHAQVAQIYNQTTIVNNYGHRDRTIFNGGVPINIIGNAAHHSIQPVPIGSLVNPGHRGWHDKDMNNPGHRFGASTADGFRNRQYADAGVHREAFPAASAHWQAPENRRSSPLSWVASRNFNSAAQSSPGPAVSANNQWPQTRSDFLEQSRLVAPRYADTAPTIRDARPQNMQPHQNFERSSPRNITPAATRQNSGAGNSSQNWVVRNH